MKTQSYYQFEQQQYFGEQLQQVSNTYIPTCYGNIFSLVAGCPGQPLILIVHGSGPKNSSAQYIHLLQQYLVRISYIQKFYIVAIDCPGYGKSKGSKEAVKTFPTNMFKEILKGLGYQKYYAMYGHSQGGAAIFNALFEDHQLSQFMVMDRPVCGQIQRFRKFATPTLLIYDIQDDGHPIWQGKLLYKELAYSEIHTYRSSQHPYWVPDNIWQTMINFFGRYSNNRRGKTTYMSKLRPVSLQPIIKSISPLKKQQKNQQKRQSTSIKKRKSQSTDQTIKKSMKKINKQKNELIQIKEMQKQKQDLLSIYSNSLSEEQKKQLSLMQEQMKLKQEQLIKDQVRQQKVSTRLQKAYNKLHIDQAVVLGEDIQVVKIPSAVNKIQANPLKTSLKKQENQNRCAICYQNYYRPMQTNCNHIFCTKCLLQSILVDPRCPLCRTNITKKIQKKQLHQKLLSQMNSIQINKRQKAYLSLKLMLDSIVYMQIGNRSVQIQTKKSAFTKTKKKYKWQIFIKQKPTFKFQQVSFNINMGNQQSRPIKLKSQPFVFESRSTFSFTCEIIMKPKSNQYAPLTAIYRINVEPGTHTKVIAFKKKIFLK